MSTPPSLPQARTAYGAGRQVVLDVDDLRVHYRTPTGDVKAVNGVTFQVFAGETVGLVGESGCGKTTTAMAVLRMVQPPGRIVGGSAVVAGTDVVGLNEKELREMRWVKLALIPQGASSSCSIRSACPRASTTCTRMSFQAA